MASVRTVAPWPVFSAPPRAAPTSGAAIAGEHPRVPLQAGSGVPGFAAPGRCGSALLLGSSWWCAGVWAGSSLVARGRRRLAGRPGGGRAALRAVASEKDRNYGHAGTGHAAFGYVTPVKEKAPPAWTPKKNKDGVLNSTALAKPIKEVRYRIRSTALAKVSGAAGEDDRTPKEPRHTTIFWDLDQLLPCEGASFNAVIAELQSKFQKPGTGDTLDIKVYACQQTLKTAFLRSRGSDKEEFLKEGLLVDENISPSDLKALLEEYSAGGISERYLVVPGAVDLEGIALDAFVPPPKPEQPRPARDNLGRLPGKPKESRYIFKNPHGAWGSVISADDILYAEDPKVESGDRDAFVSLGLMCQKLVDGYKTYTVIFNYRVDWKDRGVELTVCSSKDDIKGTELKYDRVMADFGRLLEVRYRSDHRAGIGDKIYGRKQPKGGEHFVNVRVSDEFEAPRPRLDPSKQSVVVMSKDDKLRDLEHASKIKLFDVHVIRDRPKKDPHPLKTQQQWDKNKKHTIYYEDVDGYFEDHHVPSRCWHEWREVCKRAVKGHRHSDSADDSAEVFFNQRFKYGGNSKIVHDFLPSYSSNYMAADGRNEDDVSKRRGMQ